MVRFLLLGLCLGLMGCVAASNKYIGIYNQAVAAKHSVVIFKEGDFEVMTQGVEQQLNSVGYNKVIYTSPTEPFMVLVKDVEYGGPLLKKDMKSYRIFLKYTKIDAGHTRIDLVNGGTKESVKDDIDRDIQKLADLISNKGNQGN